MEERKREEGWRKVGVRRGEEREGGRDEKEHKGENG